jgi:hypothetical protein
MLWEAQEAVVPQLPALPETEAEAQSRRRAAYVG